MNSASRPNPSRVDPRATRPQDAALNSDSARYTSDRQRLTLRLLDQPLSNERLEVLLPTLFQANINLLGVDVDPSASVDGWFWYPDPAAEEKNRQALERWFARAQLAHERLVCWLPKNQDAASLALPAWFDELPAHKLLLSHSDTPARLANELKDWFRSNSQLTTEAAAGEWLWLVHPEDSLHDLKAFHQLQAHQPIVRRVLTAPIAYQTLQAFACPAINQFSGIVIFVGQASEWASALASLLWKEVRQREPSIPLVLVVDWSQRRNQYLALELPGVRIIPYEPGREIRLTPEATDQVQFDYSPYIGLRPYDERDAPFFLGRTRSVEAVTELLQQNRYAFITGSSGDGKSSLVNAGVIPALRAGLVESVHARWAVAYFRPEASPLRNLAHALLLALHLGQPVEVIEENLSYGFAALIDLYRASQQVSGRRQCNLLLVVDQMEEFFTHGENFSLGQLSPEAYTTATLLAETIESARREGLPLYTLFTLRSDYLGACARLPGFSELIGQSVYFIPQLNAHELELAIQGPAELLGRRLTPRLLRQLLQDADATQDPLPLLQHALSQIWRQAQPGEDLDLMHYNRAAGLPARSGVEVVNRLQACLNHHAENLCQSIEVVCSEAEVEVEKVLESLFRALIRYDGNTIIRRPASLSELKERMAELNLTSEQLLAILQILRSPAHTFLRPYVGQSPESNILEPHTLIDLTHEALIRNWDRLEKWADDEVRDVNRLRELKAQTDRWLQNQCSSRYLLGPGVASYFDRWLSEVRPHPRWVASHLFPGERRVSAASLAQAEACLAAMRQLIDRSLRRNRISRRLAIGSLSVIGLLGVLSALLYWNYYNEAEQSLVKSRRIIRQERALAEQQRIISANLAREAENARILAEQQRLLNEQRLLQEEQRRKEAIGQALEANKAARLARIEREIAQREKELAENLRRNAEEQSRLSERQADIERETAKQANLIAEQARRERQNAEKQRNEALLFQSRYLAAMAQKQVQARQPEIGLLLALKALPQNLNQRDRPFEPLAEAALYSAAHAIENEKLFPILIGHKNIVTSAYFLPNGTQLVTTSHDRTARGWNLSTGQLLFSFTHNNIVRRAESSSDSRWLLTLSDDYQVHVWDLNKKTLYKTFGDESELMRLARISPDGRWIVTVSGRGQTRIWDREKGELIMDLPYTSEVRSLAFSLQSDHLLISTAGEGVEVVNLLAKRREATFRSSSGGINCAAFSPDLKFVVAGGDDQKVRIWDWRTGRLLHQLYGHKGSVVDLTFAPNGRWFITAGSEGTVRVWSIGGDELAVLPDAGGLGAQVLVSNDSQRIACLNGNRQLKLWDGNSFLLLATFDDRPLPGFGLSFHPSGRALALAGYDFKTRIYKVLPGGQELINYCTTKLKNRDLTEDELQRYLNK